jgi:hypothetical protein
LAAPAHADAIFDWNAKAEAITTEKRSSTLSRAQSLAILHVAMFEAINALELQNEWRSPIHLPIRIRWSTQQQQRPRILF